MISDLYNILIDNVKKWWKIVTLLETRIKTKKVHPVLEFNKSQWLKLYIEFNTEKRIEGVKNNDKDGKVLYKLMNNAIYEKTMENVRNEINLKLVNSKEKY